jgi:hypothetical protein
LARGASSINAITSFIVSKLLALINFKFIIMICDWKCLLALLFTFDFNEYYYFEIAIYYFSFFQENVWNRQKIKNIMCLLNSFVYIRRLVALHKFSLILFIFYVQSDVICDFLCVDISHPDFGVDIIKW